MKTALLCIPALLMVVACSGASAPEETTDTADTATSALHSSSAHRFHGRAYLALGDSIAFGSNPTLSYPVSNFVGYPELVAQDLRFNLANASCSGETSGSFLDENAPNTGCHSYFNGVTWPTSLDQGLKVDWASYDAENQADYAAAFLADKHHRTKLVTLNIGANDINMVLIQCGGMTDAPCIIGKLPATMAAYQQHLAGILGKLRATGYDGQIVVTNQYAFNYADPLQGAVLAPFNSITTAVAAQFNADVADVFTAFATGAASAGGDACAAGLLIKLPNGSCDQHPSRAGQKIIAQIVESKVAIDCDHDHGNHGNGNNGNHGNGKGKGKK